MASRGNIYRNSTWAVLTMKLNVLLNFSPLSRQTQDPFSVWHSRRDVTKGNHSSDGQESTEKSQGHRPGFDSSSTPWIP